MKYKRFLHICYIILSIGIVLGGGLSNEELSEANNQSKDAQSDASAQDSEQIVYRHQDVLAWDQTEDEKVFQSLLELLQSLAPHTSQQLNDALLFIMDSIRRQSCSVCDLHEQFRTIFFCNDSRIVMISLKSQSLRGNFDVSLIPHTVRSLHLARNGLTSISGLDRLAGKNLKYLNLLANPLHLNLRPLLESAPGSIGNPLRYLHVNAHQICLNLSVQCNRSDLRSHQMKSLNGNVHEAATQWIEKSILKQISMGNHKRPRVIQKKNRLVSQSKNNIL